MPTALSDPTDYIVETLAATATRYAELSRKLNDPMSPETREAVMAHWSDVQLATHHLAALLLTQEHVDLPGELTRR
ncbi:hypothetical protein [Arsenicicoccus dermatophilus]|uniref:hypothetical protein n=1 Tax=Arsenicicoccus dermatophilus TaxID=1076331 RepID=UPI003917322A